MNHVPRMYLVLALFAGGCGKSAAVESNEPSEAQPALRITYEVEGDAAAAAAVMEKRFKALQFDGVRARADGGHVLVEMRDADEALATKVREIASRPGKLAFFVVEANAEPMRALADHVGKNEAARELKIAVETEDGVHLVADDREEVLTEAEGRRRGCWHPGMPLRGGGKVSCPVLGRTTIETYVAQVAAAGGPNIPDDHTLIYERVSPTSWRTYYTARADALAGARIAGIDEEVDEEGAHHTVIQFDDNGKRILGELTGAHIGDTLAIMLDEMMLSASAIEAPIADGRLVLTAKTRRDAENLVIVEAGALPSAAKELSVDKP